MSTYLGSGWSFPVTVVTPADPPAAPPEPNPIRMTANGEERVRESIRLILSTAPGERLMRPDFGCAIHDLVFAADDHSTLGRAANAVRSALVRWEPRIEVLKVKAERGEEPGLLLVDVEFRLRSSDSRFNLVYPFYLE